MSGKSPVTSSTTLFLPNKPSAVMDPGVTWMKNISQFTSLVCSLENWNVVILMYILFVHTHYTVKSTGLNYIRRKRKLNWYLCTSVLPASWTRKWQQPILSALCSKSIKCCGFLPFTTIIISLNMSTNSKTSLLILYCYTVKWCIHKANTESDRISTEPNCWCSPCMVWAPPQNSI